MTDHSRSPNRAPTRRETPQPRDPAEVTPPPAIETGAPLPAMRSRMQRATMAAAATFRWECPCRKPPVLLATYTASGRLNIKVRDRYWHLFGFGQVQAICPRCAAEHVLDLRSVDSG